jgi:hypothetical protein
MFAACRLLISEGTDPQGVMAERERLMNRIRQDVGTRDEQPDGLSDYYGRWDVRQDLREAGYTRMLRYRIIGRQIYFVEIQLGGV